MGSWRRRLVGTAAGLVLLVSAAVGAGLTLRGAAESDGDTVTVTRAVSTESDDAEERSSGTVRLGSRTLELTADDSNQTVGFRFTDLAIPAGAVIESAWVDFVAASASSEPTSLEIAAEAADDAATFVDDRSDVSIRSLTTPRVRWAPPPWTSAGSSTRERSPELRLLIQNVTDRPGWRSGNALVLIVTGQGRRVAVSFDDDPAAAPRLTVEFSAPASSQPEVQLVSGYEEGPVAEGPLLLQAGASDAEDGDLSDAIVWASDIDGELGRGPQITARLSVGAHRVTATVRDGDGIGGAAAATIDVRPDSPVVVAGGNVARCSFADDERTARLLQALPEATIVGLGDLAYSDGTAQEYQDCFAPSWGAFADRLYAVPGNRDYHSPAAQPFFDFFGGRAGASGAGWYSFDIGQWHVVGLNSNCSQIGGCERSSPQGLWLENDLASNPSACTLVLTHHARYSSGARGPDESLSGLWEILRAHNADVVLSAADGAYERFAPQDADGAGDAGGIRQFVVGTAGGPLDTVAEVPPSGTARLAPLVAGPRVANSESFDASVHGILLMVLRPTGYSWTFVPALETSFRDSGAAECNTEAPAARPLEVSIEPGPSDADLVARASGADGSDRSGEVIWWSDRDGEVGSGPTLDRQLLSVGRHRLVAELRDGDGSYGAAVSDLDVLAPSGGPLRSLAVSPVESGDDAEEVLGTGKMALASSDLEVVDGRSDQVVGVRFPDVAIPRGARIVRARLQFTSAVAETDSQRADLVIAAQAADNPPAFSLDPANVSSRRTTRSTVTWSPPRWGDDGDATPDQRSPDLRDVVQELVDRPGWRSGNAMVLVINGEGTRTAEAVDGKPGRKVVLEIDYVSP